MFSLRRASVALATSPSSGACLAQILPRARPTPESRPRLDQTPVSRPRVLDRVFACASLACRRRVAAFFATPRPRRQVLRSRLALLRAPAQLWFFSVSRPHRSMSLGLAHMLPVAAAACRPRLATAAAFCLSLNAASGQCATSPVALPFAHALSARASHFWRVRLARFAFALVSWPCLACVSPAL